MLLPIAFAAVAGLLVGSFLNVVAYRLPLRESLVSPRSRCPQCGSPVRPYDNVPVLSWLVLRGRCRDCSAGISPQYPLVELVTGVLYALVALAADDALDVALGLILVTALVPITLIDLEHRLIPNRITGPAAAAALVAIVALGSGFLVEALVAAAAGGGFFLLAAIASPKGMGLGDVKFVAVLGLFLGRALAPAILVALVLGVAVGVVIIARKGTTAGRKTAVPFGPFLAIGGLVAYFVGDAIVDGYVDRV
jgi:leader peptidase (prepilin peptidase) / N-methyltransferase